MAWFVKQQAEIALTLTIGQLSSTNQSEILPKVERLLKNCTKLDVNYQDENDDTPLMIAVSKNSIELVKLLFKYGAHPNIKKRQSGWTAIFEASKNGYFDCCKVLLENGALVNVTNSNGMTPLMFACGNGHTKIVELLLTHGAQLHFKDHYVGGTALYMAIFNDGCVPDVIEILINHSPQIVNQPVVNCPGGQTPLQTACEKQNFRIAEMLLEHGAHVDQQDERGVTALIKATGMGDYRISKLLLDHGANVNLLDCFSTSALMYSCMCRKQTDPRSTSPSAKDDRSNGKLTKLFLDHGAKVDQQTISGWTALMIASINGYVENAKVLLDHGAQVDLRDDTGYTALMKVCFNEGGNVETAKHLLERGAQVNMLSNDRKKSPLIIACTNGFAALAKILLEHGAQINVKNSDGISPLKEARLNGHEDVAAVLLEFGAQDDLLDDMVHGKHPPAPKPKNLEEFQSSSATSQLSNAKVSEQTSISESFRNGNQNKKPSVTEEQLQAFLAAMNIIGQATGTSVTAGMAKSTSHTATYCQDGTEATNSHSSILSDAFRLLLPLAGEWKSIGVLLKLNVGKLNTIFHNHSTVQDRLREMLLEWLKQPDPTLQALADAVEPFDPKIAKDIRAMP